MKQINLAIITAFIIENFTKLDILKILTDRQVVDIDFLLIYRKLPNLKTPKSMSEKIQWLKLFGGIEQYSDYVDKFKVRNFVKKTIGSKYLVPLIGVWEKGDNIDFTNLPNEFVLKATHGSGYVYRCKDKSSVQIVKVRKIVDKWLRENFYDKMRETQYKNCNPKVIAEKYLRDDTGELTDYKVLCTNGRPKMIEIHLNRYTNHKVATYDLKWRRLPFMVANEDHNLAKDIPKPANLTELLTVARKLSKRFPFVRVDLYSVNKKVYFSELTFTPANGLLKYRTLSMDRKMGKLIDISDYKNGPFRK